MNDPAGRLLNRPPPFGAVHNWLGLEMVNRLLAHSMSHRHLFEDSTIAYPGDKKVNPKRRISLKLKELGDLKGELEASWRSALPMMIETLGSQKFIPSKIDLAIVSHGDGAFFERHKDWPTGTPNPRVISGVYYFHSAPKAFSGGNLQLYSLGARDSGPRGQHVSIEPENDSMVFFPSWFIHEVTPIQCPSGRFEDSRFALNCWFHHHRE